MFFQKSLLRLPGVAPGDRGPAPVSTSPQVRWPWLRTGDGHGSKPGGGNMGLNHEQNTTGCRNMQKIQSTKMIQKNHRKTRNWLMNWLMWLFLTWSDLRSLVFIFDEYPDCFIIGLVSVSLSMARPGGVVVGPQQFRCHPHADQFRRHVPVLLGTLLQCETWNISHEQKHL